MRTFSIPTRERAGLRRHPAHRITRTPEADRVARRAEIRHILHGPRLRTKLTVDAPGDAYEREADRVADAVMRIPAPEERVQRVCPECEEEVRRQPEGEAPEPETPSPEPEAPSPEPELRRPSMPQLNLVDDLSLRQLRLLYTLAPDLLVPLQLGDPSRFNITLVPLTPVPFFAPSSTGPGPSPAATPSPAAAPPSPAPPAPSPSPAPATTPPGAGAPPSTVPGSATLYGIGPLRFRINFEESSIELPEDVREREERFSRFAEQEPSGIDTGEMIKGLITAFLTQTPPGQELLRGITSVVGSEEPSTEPSLQLNFDLQPTPILEGEPPSFQILLEGTF